MDRLQGRTEQQCRLLLARGPSNFAIDALPVHVELGIDQDNGFATLTPRTRDIVPIEDFGKLMRLGIPVCRLRQVDGLDMRNPPLVSAQKITGFPG